LKNKNHGSAATDRKQKAKERGAIQQEILTVNANRSKYIAAEKAKAANTNTGQTLSQPLNKP